MEVDTKGNWQGKVLHEQSRRIHDGTIDRVTGI